MCSLPAFDVVSTPDSSYGQLRDWVGKVAVGLDDFAGTLTRHSQQPGNLGDRHQLDLHDQERRDDHCVPAIAMLVLR